MAEVKLTLEEMKEKLKKSLNNKRFIHSIGVMETAVKLAEIYGEDKWNAAVAGLLHDCAKDIEGEELLKLCRRNNIEVDDISREQPELLHGKIGACIAREEYGIEDQRVLDAIRHHTMGRENMSLLEKIIYIADYIEPNRNYPGIEKVRKAAFTNLDEAVLMSLDNTIRCVITKGVLIHPDTVNARNYLVFSNNCR